MPGSVDKPAVYLETTFISYLTARPPRDLVAIAHQHLTQDWWIDRRDKFRLYVSQLVVYEAGKGDAEAASQRIETMRDLPLLSITEQVEHLAGVFTQGGLLPAKASADALHLAIAAVHGMDYLLTWNCKHIANAAMRGRIEALCRAEGYVPPIICTPEELMED